MQKSIIALFVAFATVAASGCSNDRSPQPADKDKDGALRAQLMGVWERQSELGPMGYQWEFKADDVLVMREFRQWPSTSTSPKSPAGKGGGTMYHRQYKTDMRLFQETQGKWTIEGGKLIRTTKLSNGDTIRILSRIDRLTTTEFVEVSDGLDGPVKVRFQRQSAPATTRPR